MTSLVDIEKAVSVLPREEFNAFCDWFETLEAKRWEKDFESDVEAGLLDSLGEEALADFANGHFTEQ